MTNAELIEALRYCRASTCCQFCPSDRKDIVWTVDECMDGLHHDAADALEAADNRIAVLEAQEPTEKQVVDYCHKRCLVIVEEELFQKMKAAFGRIPKRGEWITDYDGFEYDVRCSVCGEEALIKECGSHDHAYSHYCPNCGAKMKTVTDCHTLEEGER